MSVDVSVDVGRLHRTGSNIVQSAEPDGKPAPKGRFFGIIKKDNYLTKIWKK